MGGVSAPAFFLACLGGPSPRPGAAFSPRAVLGVPASCPHHALGAPFPAALILVLRAGQAMFLRGLEGLPRVSAPQMSGGLFGSDSEDDDFTVAAETGRGQGDQRRALW